MTEAIAISQEEAITKLPGTLELVNRKNTCIMTQRPPTSLARDVDNEEFPRAVKNGSKLNFWPLHEIEIMNAAKAAGKSRSEIRELVKELEAARKRLFDSLMKKYQVAA